VDESNSLSEELVQANRILANEGIVEGFGHVSLRHLDGDKLLISRSISPKFVTEDDIMIMDFDGSVVKNREAQPYMESVIHRAIMRHRDDVTAVVHHHAPQIMPFVASDLDFKPVFHLAALFHGGVPQFSDYGPEYGYLIATEAEGDRMANALGNSRGQLLENHGANIVGASLKQAVLATVYFVMNARYQIQAEYIGEPTYYDGPAESLDAMVNDVILNPIAVDRMWSYLVNRLP